MKKTLIFIIIILVALCLAFIFSRKTVSEVGMKTEVAPQTAVANQESIITISPKTILPGDPVLITINSSNPLQEIFWDDKNIPIFTYDGKARGLTAVSFNEKVLEHSVKVRLANGEAATLAVSVTPREKIERQLGIPEKLGGNTPEASKTLVDNLAKENAEINNIKTESVPIWTGKFLAPLTTVFITDNYGYTRNTVGRTISHLGTDFRAPVGTEVKAMNKGIVRLAKTFTVYGNTVAIDHGLGLITFYMHLSKINVKEGDTVEAGEVIGLSGNTGYVDAAHLHISVKINGISIDPMTFLAIL